MSNSFSARLMASCSASNSPGKSCVASTAFESVIAVPANSSAVDLLLAALSSIAFFAEASLSAKVCPITGLAPT